MSIKFLVLGGGFWVWGGGGEVPILFLCAGIFLKRDVAEAVPSTAVHLVCDPNLH